MIGELHLELELRTILAMNQAQGTTANYLQEGGERWTKPRFSMLAGARRRTPTFSEAHAIASNPPGSLSWGLQAL